MLGSDDIRALTTELLGKCTLREKKIQFSCASHNKV